LAGIAEREVAALQSRYRDGIHTRLKQAMESYDTPFFDLLRYHLGWLEADGSPSAAETGKGLRPVLCLTACELAGGDWRNALPAAAGLELIHNFSLVHDDIQDQDDTRWGRATLWKVHGMPSAIAAGNAMRVIADRTVIALTESGVAPATVVDAEMQFIQRYLEMIEGQYLDMSFEQAEQVTVEQYLDMIGKKTGALIESAMYLGALVGTSDRDLAHGFGSCGRRLGLAFQIRDDYLGIWGDPAATGKPAGSDIRRKKKSLPIVHLFQQASSAERTSLDAAYAKDEVEGDNVQKVLAMLDAHDAPAYVQRSAESHAGAAVRDLESLNLSADAKRKLEAMAEFFVTRSK
jgi:geranylgeranyl diphosphate synthase type I